MPQPPEMSPLEPLNQPAKDGAVKRAWFAPSVKPLSDTELPAPPQLVDRSDSVADLSTLSWVNVLLGWIWPKANIALTKFVHEDLTARLQEALPSPFKQAHFSRFTLGNKTPEFGPIEVIRHSDTHVEVVLDMRYLSDVDFLLDFGTGGITLGIKQLQLTGRMCIVIRPVLEKMPIIGAVKVFFPAAPTVGLTFTGLAAVAHYPGIEQSIQRTVNEWLRSSVVLPNRKVFLNTTDEEDVDLLETYDQMPLGVLRVRVIRGSDLAGVNWKMLDVEKFASDPYCKLQLGTMSQNTTTVTDTTDPVWPSREPSAFFVVYHRDEEFHVEVMGEDRGGMFSLKNFTGFLGRFSISVAHMMRRWPLQAANVSARRQAQVELNTEEVNRDMLHVNDPINRGVPSKLELEAEWFDTVHSPPEPSERRALQHRMDGGPLAVLLVGIHKGEGFPYEAVQKGGLRWRTLVQDGDKELDPMLTRAGSWCDVLEAAFPEVPLHPRLWSVIDKLVDRGYNEGEIAQIVDAENTEVIYRYLQCKQQYERDQDDILHAQQQPGHRESLEWHQVLPHFLRKPESATLVLELVDREGREIGRIGPVPLARLLEDPEAMGRQKFSLTLRGADAGIASWFMSSNAPEGAERFSTVLQEVSVRMHWLKEGRGLPHRGRR
mmetsp:Transcript_71453/g.209818  ORF Transcript_71453/g.209818 Transcript_71453/m.209818 type:complete len:658 (-) Transcript_71453:2-1975(-)